MKNFENVNPFVFTASAVTLGFLLIDDLSALEQNAIGNWLVLVGQLLETNSSQQLVIESRVYNNGININNKTNKSIYNPLFYDLKKLKEVVNNTTPENSGHLLEMLQKLLNNLEKYIKTLNN